MIRDWLPKEEVQVEGLMTITIQNCDSWVFYDYEIGNLVEGRLATASITEEQLGLLKDFIAKSGSKFKASLEEDGDGYKFSYIAAKRKNQISIGDTNGKKFSKKELEDIRKSQQEGKTELGWRHLIIA